MGGLFSKGNKHFDNVKKLYKLVSGVIDIAAQFSYAEISEEQKKDYMDNLDKHGPISKEALLSQMQAKGYPKIHGKSNEDVDKILETMAMSIPSNIDLPVYVEPKKKTNETTGGMTIYTIIAQGVISVANSPAGQGILLSVNDSAKKIVDDPGGYIMRIHKSIGPQALVKDAFSTLNEIREGQSKHKLKQIDDDTLLLKKQGLTKQAIARKLREKYGGNENSEAVMIAKIVVLVLFVIAFAVYFTYESPAARNATLSLGGVYLCLFLFEKFY